MKKFNIKECDKYYDPFHTFKLFESYEESVFLDSSKEDKVLGRFSFVGINPIVKLEGTDEGFFKEVEELVNKHKFKVDSYLPFIGGVIGYFSYDISRTLEKLPNTTESREDIPLGRFNLYENLIIFDLEKKRMFISSFGYIEDSITLIEERFKDYKEEETNFKEGKNTFTSNFSEEEYINGVEKVRSYIESGDVYIANLTRRVECVNKEPSFEIYKRLREINKAPFSAYISYKDFSIISSSPERFLSIIDNKVSTRPIKGTRPRGKDRKEDHINKEALINSEKDKAELLMVVDLERNDLSKVCKPHSVKVTELFEIEEYATVFHLVANIEGELEEGVSAVKCMKECFPGGSITGTPKIRTMEVIEEIEGLKRNLYTGSIGYFDIRGNCDFNIVIRTIIKKDNKAFFGVGGGITYDSNPKDEYLETIDKAKALMRVL